MKDAYGRVIDWNEPYKKKYEEGNSKTIIEDKEKNLKRE